MRCPEQPDVPTSGAQDSQALVPVTACPGKAIGPILGDRDVQIWVNPVGQTSANPVDQILDSLADQILDSRAAPISDSRAAPILGSQVGLTWVNPAVPT